MTDIFDVTIDLEGPIVLDLEQIKDEPVAEGWHSVIVERADGRESQEGKPMIFVMARVHDESDLDNGRTIVWNSMLTGKGLVFTKRCFHALGLPAKLDYPSVAELCEDLIGRGCDARVRHGTVQKGPRSGEMQANVNNWRATEFDTLLVDDDDEIEQVPF